MISMAYPIILITGASSGIGREFAIQIDQMYPDIQEIWLVARRYHKLKETADLLHHKCRIFNMDITSKDQTKDLFDALKQQDVCIRMLINCAGYGMMGDVINMDADDLNGMIQLNCEALTRMTRSCLPFMKEESRILQLASSAAFLPQPGFAVYAASKAYVLSFSRALSYELKHKKIYVTAVCPGPVDTPFFDVAEKYSKGMAAKKLTMITAYQAVKKALRDAEHKRQISVSSIPMYGVMILSKLLPHNILLNMTALLKKIG